ncbi:hypothetical protein IAU59_007641 [Kwoniella sp. CBS 9459]
MDRIASALEDAVGHPGVAGGTRKRIRKNVTGAVDICAINSHDEFNPKPSSTFTLGDDPVSTINATTSSPILPNVQSPNKKGETSRAVTYRRSRNRVDKKRRETFFAELAQYVDDSQSIKQDMAMIEEGLADTSSDLDCEAALNDNLQLNTEGDELGDITHNTEEREYLPEV